MGDQTDISFLFPRLEAGEIAAVQRFQHLRVAMVLTDAVQQLQEVSVILPVYGLKLDGAIFRLLQRAAGEEIGSVVVLAEHLPFLVFHHGSQLLQVANHQQLHTAKRFVGVAVAAEHFIYRIQQVGAYHTDFINHQQVHAAYDIDFLLTETEAVACLSIRAERAFGHIRRKRNLKERMDGNTSGIDSRYAGGRNDYHTFGTFLLKLAQKSSFTGSGFACQKKMSACAFDELPRKR